MKHSINQLSATCLEQLANRVLALDPQAHQGLVPFAGKIIHLQIIDWQINYYVMFPGQSLVIHDFCNRPVSACISGKLTDFLNAALQENTGDALFTGELSFTGEINTARQFQAYIQALQIDWREPITGIFGDIAGQTITDGISQLFNFGQSLFKATQQNIPEYLQEEARVTPTASEQAIFFDNIDLLRSQADRLSARVSRLEQNFQK
ncbi:ubiquinone biosynthesis accessory factor UbiJ [Aliikangiella maris]|uniref:Ubiquinone biosynthesis accessory factor UbiJ n=2 Tax=Aliikangiella maris TaxID=3162458 RepID=A0ABV2BWS6_9GAMM